MRLFQTISWTLIPLLLAGCSTIQPAPPPIEEALFCDLVSERFRYTQNEWNVRVATWPANLRREIEINQHYERECVDAPDE